MEFQSPLRVIIKANNIDDKLLGYDESRKAYRVGIAAPAREGKANIRLVKFFSKLTKKKVRIISGKTSKLKTLLLE